ncbi:MAG: dTDP-4-dehydrorhamnose reductase [Alphaproteobacteria bacterium]
MGLRILQFGRTGQVGVELLIRGLTHGHHITALGRDTVDLAQPRRVASCVSTAGPIDIVINGAAYMQVDKAEAEPDRANAVNAESVAMLAEVCAKRAIPLIHLSTDYVFDGRKTGPYVETDPPAPLNAYGASKLLGEEAIRTRCSAHIILRTSWVFSAHGTNFVKTMLRLGVERDELRIVDDQWGAPTAAGDIAETCLAICERIAGDRDKNLWGTYHYTSSGETTWRRFAEAIFELAPWAGAHARVIPIPSTDYPTPALRPLNSRLDCSKFDRVFAMPRKDWRAALVAVLAELKSARENAR